MHAVILSCEQFVSTQAGAAALPLCCPSPCRNWRGSANPWAIQELPALVLYQESWGCSHLMGLDLSYQSNFYVFLIFHCYPESSGTWLGCCIVAGQLKLFLQPHMKQQTNQSIATGLISNVLKAIGRPVVPAPFL